MKSLCFRIAEGGACWRLIECAPSVSHLHRMPKKKVVTSPIPADLLPAVDELIRNALSRLPAHIEAPVSLAAELTEALHTYRNNLPWTELLDDAAGQVHALRARVRPLEPTAHIPGYLGYQLSQRLYRYVATTGKWLGVPELLGFADVAVQVSVPGDVKVKNTSTKRNRLTAKPEDLGVLIGTPTNDTHHPSSPRKTKKAPTPEYEMEFTFKPTKQWWRYVVAPRGSAIASTFQRLQQLRAWAIESDIVVQEGVVGYLLPRLGPAHFGVISDDEELCRMAKEQGFRSLLITS